MQFTLKDHVKLATKGYKLNDIAELSEIDDSKFDKDDIMALVGSGYRMADIKKLVEAFKDPEDNPEDEQGNDDQDQKNTNSAKDSKKTSNDNKSDDVDDPDDKDNIIDYKEAYEKEKKLREKLQQKNVNSLQGSGSGQTKTDEELAIELAEKILR